MKHTALCSKYVHKFFTFVSFNCIISFPVQSPEEQNPDDSEQPEQSAETEALEYLPEDEQTAKWSTTKKRYYGEKVIKSDFQTFCSYILPNNWIHTYIVIFITVNVNSNYNHFAGIFITVNVSK